MCCHWFLPCLAVLAAGPVLAARPEALAPVPFPDVHISDDFWGQRLRTNRTATVEANLHQCEITGRIKNFAIAAGLEKGKYEGELYNDSDVYKVLEGVAYTLADKRDPDLEKRADAIIDLIAAAQQPDGYLDTYWTLVKPKERWQHEQFGHELYCAGHLFEAAVAYQQATGKEKLLKVACKLADHIDSVFGPDKRHETSGHEEIELALIKLYRATGRERYLKLALYFLDQRGKADGRKLFGEYAQDMKPVREQTEVVGHAVRAMYLYCAMADAAAITGDQGLLDALDSIWRDVTERKMYVTGGIGPSASNEGFTVPYDLPNDTAYCETCAAVGMALWNHRLFLMSGDGKYADVLEREAYNGLTSGVSEGGDRFFYENPLGSKGGHHRVPWFGTSCCPTNIVRYIPAMGERVYATKGDAVWAVLYMGNTADLSLASGKLKLEEETKYPWEGDVQITVKPEKPFAFDLNLRVPGWCEDEPAVTVNGQKQAGKAEKGYLRISRTWKPGDVVRLSLPMPVRRVYADPHVKADEGRVALQRGPVVYCLEGVDNGGQARNFILPKDAKLTAEFQKDLLGGVVVVKCEGQAVVGLDDDDKPVVKPASFTAVPYCVWDNRKPGPMAVWLPERPEAAEPPGDLGVLSNGVRVKASHVWQNDTLAAVNDGVTPKNSNDHSIPRHTWWDHRGTGEWMAYRFPKPRQIDGCSIYWFDDTGAGQCRVPVEWRLLYRDGDDWKPVKPTGGSAYGAAPDQFNKITFEPVTTRELKIEVKLQKDFSGGVLKWTVSAAK